MATQGTRLSRDASLFVAGEAAAEAIADHGWVVTQSGSTRRSRLGQNLELWLPVGGLVFIVLACFFGPLIFNVPSPTQGDILHTNAFPFTPGHLLGSNPVGYDTLSRILYGGRVSLEVGFGAQLVGVLLGATIGMFAAFKGGAVDALLMRLMDLLLAFPGLVIALTIAAYLGASELHVIEAISFLTVPSMARFARAQSLRYRDLDFVVSSRLYGQKDRWILVRHLAPNVFPNLLTIAVTGVAVAIQIEAGLSFLGLGVPAPGPSWGNMISDGQNYLSTDPYLVIIPAAFLLFTVTCLNLMSDAIRARISSR